MGKSRNDKICLKLLLADRLSADVFKRHLKSDQLKKGVGKCSK